MALERLIYRYDFMLSEEEKDQAKDPMDKDDGSQADAGVERQKPVNLSNVHEVIDSIKAETKMMSA